MFRDNTYRNIQTAHRTRFSGSYNNITSRAQQTIITVILITSAVGFTDDGHITRKSAAEVLPLCVD